MRVHAGISMASENPGKAQVALVSTDTRHWRREINVVPAVRACFWQAIRLTACRFGTLATTSMVFGRGYRAKRESPISRGLKLGLDLLRLFFLDLVKQHNACDFLKIHPILILPEFS